MLTCQEVVELVTDYLEGALVPVDHAAVQAHLAGCAGCATYVDQLRVTVRALGGMRESGLTAPACRELVEAFATWPPGDNSA